MQLYQYDEVEPFYRRIMPFLMQREVEHGLILGICDTLMQPIRHYSYPAYMALVDNHAGDVLAVALRTPPHNLLISHVAHNGAIELIAKDVREEYGTLPGVSARTDVASAFAECWHAMTGQAFSVGMSQRIYRLDVVTPVSGVSGVLRRAQEDDRDLLAEWFIDFHTYTFARERATQEQAENWVDRMMNLSTGGLFVWCDPHPVSMVAAQSPTPNGIRISGVYTPPEARRRGYASAVVAAVSQMMLDEGLTFCFLYTDLSNPTSNRIYQDIGYYPVCDATAYAFDEQPLLSKDRT